MDVDEYKHGCWAKSKKWGLWAPTTLAIHLRSSVINVKEKNREIQEEQSREICQCLPLPPCNTLVILPLPPGMSSSRPEAQEPKT